MPKKRVFGYPTPDSLPEESHCRQLRIPDSEQWLSVVMGAIYALTQEDNWQKVGNVTPAEAAAVALQIFSDAYKPVRNNCSTYVLPSGTRIIRISPSGHLQEVDDEGDWAETTGEYAVPPIPTRGGEPQDARCLAAANCANVLEQLYETITDAIAHGLSDAETYAAIAAAFVTITGWEFAPIAAAIAAFILAVIGVIIAVVGELAADVWDSTFNDTLKCVLYNCSSIEAGIVTFDWQGFQDGLARATNPPLTWDGVRLFGQLVFIVQSIGGADGLNAAGGTTEITTADCSDCDTGWCYKFDFTVSDGGFEAYLGYGNYVPGVGWQSVPVGDEGAYSVLVTLLHSVTGLTAFAMTVGYDVAPTSQTDPAVSWAGYDGGFGTFNQFTPLVDIPNPNTYSVSGFGPYGLDGIALNASGNSGSGAVATIVSIQLAGTGVNPFGADNC